MIRHLRLAGLVMMLAAESLGRTYHVSSLDPRATDAGGGTPAQPWKTLSPVGSHAFVAGDSILFERGSSFTGGVTINGAGTAGRPITLSAYGTGPAPRFTNPALDVLDGNVIRVTGSRLVVDGLCFHDGPTAPVGSKRVFRMGAVFIDKGGDHSVIRNSEVVNCPMGFNVQAEACVVTGNKLHDCTRFLEPPGWGPIGIFIGNANIEIAHNRIENYVATGGTYGADGGALEIDPRLYNVEAHDIAIHHNYSYGNEGFLEITKATERINLSYNVSIDYQQFVLFWAGTNCVVENNTVVRVLPKNSVTDVVFAFRRPGNVIRNNIFVVSERRQVFSDNGSDKRKTWNYQGQTRDHNLYFSVDGTQTDPCGLPLGEGEKIADPGFVDYACRDFHLRPDSPAIDAGVGSGRAVDWDGREVPLGRARDIGAFEFGGKSPPPRVSAPAGVD